MCRRLRGESGVLQVTDSTLSEVVSQLTSAVSLATQANNGTLNSENREAIVNQLKGIQGQVLSLANTNYLGQYLFAGSQAGTKPFALDASTGAATVFRGIRFSSRFQLLVGSRL